MAKTATVTAKKSTMFRLGTDTIEGLAAIRDGLTRMTGLDHTVSDALRYAVQRVSTDFQAANATQSTAKKIRK